MKYIVVLTCCFAFAYGISPELKAKIHAEMLKLGEKCRAEINPTPEDIGQIMAKIVPTTQEGKCFLACMGKALGLQSPDGKMSRDGALAVFEHIKTDDPPLYEKVVQVADKCSAEPLDGADECQTAANMMECSLRVGKELGIQDTMANHE